MIRAAWWGRCWLVLAKLLVALALGAGLAGCAVAPRTSAPVDPQMGPWSGRMSLQVKDQPSQSFALGFELSGNSQAGELHLSSPLGGTLAALSWRPGRAVLRSGGVETQYDSVDALLQEATGTAIPVAALFDWLRGVPTQVAGWNADLSDWAAGRVRAARLDPPPEVDLRVVLDR